MPLLHQEDSIMRLKHILAEYRDYFAEFADFRADIVIENPDAPEGVEVYPVIAIEIDDENQEINFCSRQFSSEPSDNGPPLSLGQIIEKVASLTDKYLEYSIYSAHGHVPMTGMGPNPETQSFGFIQEAEKQARKWWQFWKAGEK